MLAVGLLIAQQHVRSCPFFLGFEPLGPAIALAACVASSAFAYIMIKKLCSYVSILLDPIAAPMGLVVRHPEIVQC